MDAFRAARTLRGRSPRVASFVRLRHSDAYTTYSSHVPLAIRPLVARDVPAVARLAAAQHWDQPVSDIELILRLIEADSSGPSAALGHFAGSELVSCAAMLRIDMRTSWLSYVVTDTGWRGRGLARVLCERLVRGASEDTLGLIGTAPAQPLYRSLGFEGHAPVTLLGRVLRPPLPAPSSAAPTARALGRDELEEALRAETATRAAALRAWYAEWPHLALGVRDDFGLLACAFGRPWGADGTFIGPVLASRWERAPEAEAAVRNVLVGAMAAARASPAANGQLSCRAFVLLGRGGRAASIVHEQLGFGPVGPPQPEPALLMIRRPPILLRDRGAAESAVGLLACNGLPAHEVLAAGYDLA